MGRKKIKNEQKISNKSKKVLIVDDKSVNRFVLKGIFEDDYEVLECKDGAEALSTLESLNNDVTVILLDIVMPGFDGFSVLEYMKKNKLSHIPVVLVSANVNDENIRKAYDYDVADYIQKPFEEEIVRARVEAVIFDYENRIFDGEGQVG